MGTSYKKIFGSSKYCSPYHPQQNLRHLINVKKEKTQEIGTPYINLFTLKHC